MIATRQSDPLDPPDDSVPPPKPGVEDVDIDHARPGTLDDECWDVFIPDDDQRDPLPEAGDFWNDEFSNDE